MKPQVAIARILKMNALEIQYRCLRRYLESATKHHEKRA